MAKSIIQKEKECYICRSCRNLESHHIFFGEKNRKWSEKYGLKVWLCPYDHRDNKDGVHGQNVAKRLYLQRIAQEAFEKTHSREEFVRIFGKNYAQEEEEESQADSPGITWIR